MILSIIALFLLRAEGYTDETELLLQDTFYYVPDSFFIFRRNWKKWDSTENEVNIAAAIQIRTTNLNFFKIRTFVCRMQMHNVI